MSQVRWEHRLVDLPTERAEAQQLLDLLGTDGWELAGVLPPSTSVAVPVAFLKRLVTPVAPAEPAVGQEGPSEPLQPGFRVVVTGLTAEKANVVVAVAQICPWLHLKDAKRLLDLPPSTLASGLSEEDAIALGERLTAAGATIELLHDDPR